MRHAFLFGPVLFTLILAGCSKPDPSLVGPPSQKADVPAQPKKTTEAAPPQPAGGEPVPEAPLPPAIPKEPPPSYDDLPPEEVQKVLKTLGGDLCFFEVDNDGVATVLFEESKPSKEFLPGFEVSKAVVKGTETMPVVSKPFGLKFKDTKLTPAICANLAKQTNLTRLAVDPACVFDSACLKELAKIPNLRQLSLENFEAEDRPPVDLTPLAGFKSLRSLRLFGFKKQIDPALKAIGALASLRELDINEGGTWTAANYSRLAGLKELRLLRLYSCEFPEEGFGAVSTLRKLENLDIFLCGKVRDDDLRHLAPLVRLRTLRFVSTDSAPTQKVAEDSARAIARLTGLEELELMLSTWALTDSVVSQVAACRRLKRLKLDGLDKVTSAGLAKLASLKELEKLELANVSADAPGGWKSIAALAKLQEFGISHSKGFNDAALQTMSGSGNLTRLEISSDATVLTAAGFEKIDQLKTLKYLSVSSKGISGRVMAPISRLPAIEQLYCSDIPSIRDADMMELAKTKTLSTISYSGEPAKIKPETITALLKALPGCSISGF